MKSLFFIVGPTAAGKSELAAEVAARCGAEIVSADAFQIYRGLDVLTGKPELTVLAKAPHHLLSVLPLSEELNAAKFRTAALKAIEEIHGWEKPVIVVGGSGLYIKTLTHGLSELPDTNSEIRSELNRLSANELYARLTKLDPETANKIDRKNPRRLVRALEICLITGQAASAQRRRWEGVAAPKAFGAATASKPHGVFVFRDRIDLYERINRRVDAMFDQGVVEEVRSLPKMGMTAAKALGLRTIQEMIAGRISKTEAIASIQQATRQYAKRQLTWFRRQTNFEPLNLSPLSLAEAAELISRKVRRCFAQ